MFPVNLKPPFIRFLSAMCFLSYLIPLLSAENAKEPFLGEGLFFSCLDIELRRLFFGGVEGLAARGGEIEVDAGVFGDAPVLLGAVAVLDAVEGFAEHGVVGFFAVEQEVDGLADAFVIDLFLHL